VTASKEPCARSLPITQERLKELLHYCPETGVFTNRVNRRPRGKAGAVAGNFCGGYIEISLDNQTYRAHRLAFLWMTASFPPDQTDHINGIRDDNRWVNLRAVSDQENKRNLKRPSNNRSGVIGVNWFKPARMWRAYITVDNKHISLGYHKDFSSAVLARKQAEHKHGFHSNHGRVA